MQNTFLNNLSILEEINNGKTKSIHATSDENLVAFIPKGVDVTASGSGTKEHKERIQPELMMNHNILSFFNALEIPTSYIGLFENRALIHKKPAPGALKNIEAVVYFGVCPRSSALLRYPKEYGEFDGENYSTVQPSSKYLNEDKSVNLFDKPFIELFHKKCLIIKDPNAWDASAIDMVPEASVKNKSLYFDAKGNETRYAWSDPLLVPYYDEFYGHVLLVYSRTQDR